MPPPAAPRIEDLSDVDELSELELDALLAAELAREGEPLPLSPAQLATYFAGQLAPEGDAYHTGTAGHLQGPLDEQRLREALATIVARHPQLRASFTFTEEGPRQTVQPFGEAALEVVECPGATLDEVRAHAERHARRPYAFETGPLWRAVLFRRGSDDHVLLIALHHLICDQRSMAIFWSELGRAYAGEALAPLTRSYQLWREDAERAGADRQAELEAFWRKELAAPLVPAALPTATAGGPPVLHGAIVVRTVTRAVGAGLFECGRAWSCTGFAVWLTLFDLLLHRVTGGTDFVVSTPFHGRRTLADRSVIGDCIEPTFVRSRLTPGAPIAALAQANSQAAQRGFAHVGLPIARLVQQLGPSSRRPLTQLCFSFQRVLWEEPALNGFCAQVPGARIAFGALQAECVPLQLQAGQFELELVVFPDPSGTRVELRFDDSLIERAEVERWADQLVALAERVAADPTLTVEREW